MPKKVKVFISSTCKDLKQDCRSRAIETIDRSDCAEPISMERWYEDYRYTEEMYLDATRNLNSAQFPELRNFLAPQQWTALSRLRPAETAQSLANDDTVRVWRALDWRCMAIINVSTSFAGTNAYFPALAFHPREPLLATCVDTPDEISILELDEEALINAAFDM
jgi:hypothetical protein